MVVSFMIAAPYLGAAPCGRPHPCYEHHHHHHPDPTPPPGFLSKNFSGNFSRDAGRQRSDSTTVSRRLRSTTSSAPSADKLWDQIDREDPDQSSAHAAIRAEPTGRSFGCLEERGGPAMLPSARRLGPISSRSQWQAVPRITDPRHRPQELVP